MNFTNVTEYKPLTDLTYFSGCGLMMATLGTIGRFPNTYLQHLAFSRIKLSSTVLNNFYQIWKKQLSIFVIKNFNQYGGEGDLSMKGIHIFSLTSVT